MATNIEKAFESIQGIKVKPNAENRVKIKTTIPSLQSFFEVPEEEKIKNPLVDFAIQNAKLNPSGFNLTTDNWVATPTMETVWKMTANPDYRTQDELNQGKPWWATGLEALGRVINTVAIPPSLIAIGVTDGVDLVQAGVAKLRGQDPNWDENNPFTWERTKQFGRILSGEEYFDFGKWLQKENWQQNGWSTSVPLNPLYYAGVGPRMGLTVSTSGLIATGMNIVLDPWTYFGGLGVYRQIGTAATKNGATIIKNATRETLENALAKNLVRESGQPLDKIARAELVDLIPESVVDDLVGQMQVAASAAINDGKSVQEALTRVLKEFNIEQAIMNQAREAPLTGYGRVFTNASEEVISGFMNPAFKAGKTKFIFNESADYFDELVEIADIIIRADSRKLGRSSLSVGDINKLKNWFYKHGYNADGLSQADWLAAGGVRLDDAGNPIAGAFNRNASDFVPVGPDGVKAQYGIKTPFTGDIARYWRFPSLQRIDGKLVVQRGGKTMREIWNQLLDQTRLPSTLKMADRQYGLTIFQFNNRYADKAFRAIPQAFKGTWGRGLRAMNASRYVQGMPFKSIDGATAKAKSIVRVSDNPWEVIAAKEWISYVGQGRARKESANTVFSKSVDAYKRLLGDSRKDGNVQRLIKVHVTEQLGKTIGAEPDAYATSVDRAFDRLLMSAIEGDEQAQELFTRVSQTAQVDLVEQGRLTLERLRMTANEMAGVQFIYARENYFPHQLDADVLDHLRKTKKGKNPKSTPDMDRRRGYVSTEEYDRRIAEWAKKNNIEGDITSRTVRRQFEAEEKIRKDFFGVDFNSDGFTGTVPEQIVAIMDSLGIEPNFFSYDINNVLDAYKTGLANKTGSHWVEQQMINGGWNPNASDWMTGVLLPDAKSVANTAKLTKLIREIHANQSEIDELIIAQIGADKEALETLQRNIDNLTRQKDALNARYERELTLANEHQNYMLAAEKQMIEANQKLVTLQEEIMEIIETEAAAFERTRQFRLGELNIEELPEFQALLNDNARLQEIQEEIRQLFLVGDDPNFTDTVYYHIFTKTANGVQSKALMEERLIEHFGSLEEAKQWALAYTNELALITQQARAQAGSGVGGVTFVDQDALDVWIAIPEETKQDLPKLLSDWGNDAFSNEVYGTDLEAALYSLATGMLPAEKSYIVDGVINWEAISNDLRNVFENNPTKATIVKEYYDALDDLTVEVMRLAKLVSSDDILAPSEMPELLSINLKNLTPEEAQGFAIRQAQRNLPKQAEIVDKYSIRATEGELPDELIGDNIEQTLQDEYQRLVDLRQKEIRGIDPRSPQALDEVTDTVLGSEDAVARQLADDDVTDIPTERVLRDIQKKERAVIGVGEGGIEDAMDNMTLTPEQILYFATNGNPVTGTAGSILKVGDRTMSFKEVRLFFDSLLAEVDDVSIGPWLARTYVDEFEEVVYNAGGTVFKEMELIDYTINGHIETLENIAKRFDFPEYSAADLGPIDFYGLPTVDNYESWRKIIVGYMDAGIEEKSRILSTAVASEELTNAIRRYYLLMGKTRLASIESAEDLVEVVVKYKQKLRSAEAEVTARLSANPLHQLEATHDGIRVTRETITNLDLMQKKTARAMDDGIDVPVQEEKLPIDLATLSPDEKIDPITLGYEDSEAFRSTGLDTETLDGIYQGPDEQYYLVKGYTKSGETPNGKRLDRQQRDQAVLASKVYQLLGIRAPRVEARMLNDVAYTVTRVNPNAPLIASGDVSEDIMNKVSLGFVADVLLGNWGAMGQGAKTNLGLTTKLLGEPDEVVRYGLDDTFYTFGGSEKQLDVNREYLVLEYNDEGDIVLTPKLPEAVSIDPDTGQIQTFVPDTLADDAVKTQQKYEASLIKHERDLKQWEKATEEWRVYRRAKRKWDKDNETFVLQNDMSDEDVYNLAKVELANEITAQDGLHVFPEDVVIDYPARFETKVEEINDRVLNQISVAKVQTPEPPRPSMPEPTRRPPKAPEKPKGVKPKVERGQVTYTEADGTVRVRAARKPSKIETEARKGSGVQTWLDSKGFGTKDRVYGTTANMWRRAQAAERRANKKIKKIGEIDSESQPLVDRVIADLYEELDVIFASVDDITRRSSTQARPPIRADGSPRQPDITYDYTQVMELGLGLELYSGAGLADSFLTSAGGADYLSSQLDELLNARLSVGGWDNFVDNVLPYADDATRRDLAEFLEVRTMYLAEYMQKPYILASDQDAMLKAFAAELLPEEAVLEAFNRDGRQGLLRLLDNMPSGYYRDDIMDTNVIDGVPQFLDSGQRRTLAPFAYRDVNYKGVTLDTTKGRLKIYGADPQLQGEVQPVLEAMLGLSEINWDRLDMNQFVSMSEYQMQLGELFTQMSLANPAGRKPTGNELVDFGNQILRLVGWNGPVDLMPADMIAMGDRLTDVIARIDPLLLDEVLRFVSADALSARQVASLERQLVNPFKAGQIGTIDVEIPLAGVSPEARAGKVYVNAARLSDEPLPFRVDTVSQAERKGASKAIRALLNAKNLSITMDGNPIAQAMPEGGSLKEMLEFLSWRDNKYRQIDSATDGLTNDQNLRLMMDDFAEYAFVTDPSNPTYRQEVVKAKLQSYVYVNRIFSYLSNRINKTGKGTEILEQITRQYKDSLVSEGFIATAQPRTVSTANRSYSLQTKNALIDLEQRVGNEMDDALRAGNAAMPFVMDINVVDDMAIVADRDYIEKMVDTRIRRNAMLDEPETLPSREKKIAHELQNIEPNREALVRKYEEQVKSAWHDPFTNVENIPLRDYKAKQLGYRNYDILLRDLLQMRNEHRQLQFTHNNLKQSYLERLKTVSDLQRIDRLNPESRTVSDDLLALRKAMGDDEIVESGLLDELGELEKRILYEQQAIDQIQARMLQYEDARNNVRNLMDNIGRRFFQRTDVTDVATLEEILDIASAVKQVGIADMDNADEIIRRLNTAEGLIDSVTVKMPDSMSQREKVQLEAAVEYNFNAAKRPVGLASQSADTLKETILETGNVGFRQLKQPQQTGGEFWRHYDQVHNFTKGYLIMKTGFIARNFYGAVWQNYLAGVVPTDYGRFLAAFKYLKKEAEVADLRMYTIARDMTPAMRKKIKKIEATRDKARTKTNPRDINIVKQMMDRGHIGKSGSGYYAQEFIPSTKRTFKVGKKTYNTVYRPLSFAKGRLPLASQKEIDVLRAFNPFSSQNVALKGFRKMNTSVEDIVRGTVGFSTLDKGGNIDDAWNNIVKYHFDYTDLSNFERNVVKRLFPFYTFTRHNIPLQVAAFFQQPRKFYRYMLTMESIRDKENRRVGPVPDWMLRQGGVRLPEQFDYEGNPVYFIPDLPVRGVFDFFQEPAEALAQGSPTGVIGGLARSVASMGTPLVKAPIEVAMNRNIWKNYSFKNRYEYVPTYMKPIAAFMHATNIGEVEKLGDGNYAMKSNWLHGVAQFVPIINDLRRIAPVEEKYRQRHFSSIMSWFLGIGLRTLTPYEIESAAVGKYYENRQKQADANRLRILEIVGGE